MKKHKPKEMSHVTKTLSGHNTETVNIQGNMTTPHMTTSLYCVKQIGKGQPPVNKVKKKQYYLFRRYL